MREFDLQSADSLQVLFLFILVKFLAIPMWTDCLKLLVKVIGIRSLNECVNFTLFVKTDKTEKILNL